MKAAYYPGCSLHSTATEYDGSVRQVLGALDIQLQEVPEWNCCGATPAHASDEYISLALPLRNMARAGSTGLDQLVVPCAACYNSLRSAGAAVAAGQAVALEAAADVSRITKLPTDTAAEVVHPVDLLTRPPLLAALRDAVKSPLAGVKVASYYGCLLVRPSAKVAFEDPEQPTAMDRLMAAAGAQPVTWSYKVDCCGGSLAMSRSDAVARLCNRIIDGARQAGADVIATSCPMCQANLETRQSGGFPILYFTELLGIALDLDGWKQWIKKHIVPIPPHILPTDRE